MVRLCGSSASVLALTATCGMTLLTLSGCGGDPTTSTLTTTGSSGTATTLPPTPTPSPATTTAAPTPEPAPTPPAPPAPMSSTTATTTCMGAPVSAPSCSHKFSDDDLLDEFEHVGVAFTMLPINTWANPGCVSGPFDSGAFYATPPREFLSGHQQAVTINNATYRMKPYPGYNQPYGVVLHVSEQSQFWKYFQVSTCGTPPAEGCDYGPCGSWDGAHDVIVGGPGDGKVGHPSADCRSTLDVQGKDYAWFTEQKEYILSLYKKVYPKTGDPYNEFDTNGLSACDLAGVLYWEGIEEPGYMSEDIFCRFLTYWNPSKTHWPVYKYGFHSLSILRTMDCSGAAMFDNATVFTV